MGLFSEIQTILYVKYGMEYVNGLKSFTKEGKESFYLSCVSLKYVDF